MGVAHSAVLTWFKDLAEATPATPAKPTDAPEHVELDELFTFVQNKKRSLHAELRHYLKCLARKTRCFAKLVDSLIRRIELFAYCWNQRQLQRWAFPKYVPPLFSFASYHC